MNLIERLKCRDDITVGVSNSIGGSKVLVRAQRITDCLEAAKLLEKYEKALKFYADPNVYKPHPHGPAFDNRDISFVAINALKDEE